MPATKTLDDAVPRIAAAIGEPARARILFCLMANRARTSTELAGIAEVSPPTASVHLSRLKAEGLVKVVVQGKHRYYSLASAEVAHVLESLSVLAGGARDSFIPSTPEHLRDARTCYDHIAGTLGVAIHDRLQAMGWLTSDATAGDDAFDITPKGTAGLAALGVSVADVRSARRRLAFSCLDWSERRSHLGGALGAALLQLALRKRWVAPDRESRALRVTALGQRDFATHLALKI